ncbi:TetR/AcrR family transcriptional regulator [Nocardia rhizosphaerihabitans]|uniref:TetR family transcriptional regulator n=1 Tax=Nocardia rhizosphaerihabitans TaxID=1691570 RepID=A0ABQ2KC66_9NOCA|nr:TetR/AcrR family transcriptional regulator [Nocardia rhizosphaerihabitans]GGN77895.1 TetR family transcriptional regulator [Nocardia rhizosphaerihabitans]
MAYHHGDLAAALVEAGLDLTRSGGPEALTIREVTRRVGVTPNAAYRHFPDRQALLRAVSAAIEAAMATGMAAERGLVAPRESLRAVGLGYIGFALAEPGWFAVAFFGAGDTSPESVLDSPAYLALADALDMMVHIGDLAPAARRSATWSCWSTVHGFAELALRGPLRHLDRAELWKLAEQAVDTIIAGLPRVV